MKYSPAFILFSGLLFLLSCSSENYINPNKLDPAFEVYLDESTPGKVLFEDKTSGEPVMIEYELWEVDSNRQNERWTDPTQYAQSYYGKKDSFYAIENMYLKVTHKAYYDTRGDGGWKSLESIKYLKVENVPDDSVIIKKMVVTQIAETDSRGYEWDDADGNTDGGNYESNAELPDLYAGFTPRLPDYSASKIEWDYNFKNELPYSVNLNVRMDINGMERQLEVTDVEGSPSSVINEGTAIIRELFDPKDFQHSHFHQNDRNYSEVIGFEKNGSKFEIHLEWK